MDREEEAGAARSNMEGKEGRWGQRENIWKDKTEGHLRGGLKT